MYDVCKVQQSPVLRRFCFRPEAVLSGRRVAFFVAFLCSERVAVEGDQAAPTGNPGALTNGHNGLLVVTPPPSVLCLLYTSPSPRD